MRSDRLCWMILSRLYSLMTHSLYPSSKPFLLIPASSWTLILGDPIRIPDFHPDFPMMNFVAALVVLSIALLLELYYE